MAPRITGSRNRSTRKRSKDPTSSRNRPQRSRASTNSQNITTGDSVSRYRPLQGRGALSVTQSPGSSALGAGAARVTTGSGRAALGIFGRIMSALPSVAPLLLLGGDSAKGRPGTVGYNQKRQGKAKNSIDKYNTIDSDGTVRNRLKVGEGKVGTAEQAFDKAFAAARAKGLAEFTWHGKRYSTEMA
jgi:hypothetical protein